MSVKKYKDADKTLAIFNAPRASTVALINFSSRDGGELLFFSPRKNNAIFMLCYSCNHNHSLYILQHIKIIVDAVRTCTILCRFYLNSTYIRQII